MELDLELDLRLEFQRPFQRVLPGARIDGRPVMMTSSKSRSNDNPLILACGAGTSVLTAGALVAVEHATGWELHTWMFLLVVPVGAVVVGMIAASGYYVGAKWRDRRPGPAVLAGMVSVAAGTWLLTYVLRYETLVVNGTPVCNLVGFGTFLDLAIRAETLTVRFQGMSGDTGPVGGWGYFFAGLQVLGFAGGGAAVYGMLAAQLYCDRCSAYGRLQGERARFFAAPEAFTSHYEQVATEILGGRLGGAVARQGHDGSAASAKGDYLRSTLTLSACPRCRRSHLRLCIAKQAEGKWSDLPGKDVTAWSEETVVFSPSPK